MSDATSETSYIGAIIQGYHAALGTHDEAFLLGEDVRHALMGTTRDLAATYGEDRVRDVPISEQGFTGLAVGAAMDGKRPIVEYQINTLSYMAIDQIVNNAAKLRHMTDGQVSVPLTITVPQSGAPGGGAQQHSDNTYPSLIHHGLKVVVPATPADAKGLFLSAVAEDDPVLVYWPAALMGERGEVSEGHHDPPLGEAAVRREGSDVTVVAVGETVPAVLSVAEDLAGEASVEVVDPRTLHPLDEATILDSVHKTGRLVVVDPANRACGFAGEVAARVSDRAFWSLDAPVKRVTRADVPVSYSPPEEAAVLPDASTVETAVHGLL